VSLSVDGDVDHFGDLRRGTSLSRLVLEDDRNLIWKEVSICYLVVVSVQVSVTLVHRKKQFFSCWLESNSESEVGISSVEAVGDCATGN